MRLSPRGLRAAQGPTGVGARPRPSWRSPLPYPKRPGKPAPRGPFAPRHGTPGWLADPGVSRARRAFAQLLVLLWDGSRWSTALTGTRAHLEGPRPRQTPGLGAGATQTGLICSPPAFAPAPRCSANTHPCGCAQKLFSRPSPPPGVRSPRVPPPSSPATQPGETPLPAQSCRCYWPKDLHLHVTPLRGERPWGCCLHPSATTAFLVWKCH